MPSLSVRVITRQQYGRQADTTHTLRVTIGHPGGDTLRVPIGHPRGDAEALARARVQLRRGGVEVHGLDL